MCLSKILFTLAFVAAFTSTNAQHLTWAAGFTSARAQPDDVAVDAQGNVYSTGVFEETTDFDPGPGEWTFTANGLADNYISKLNASGEFEWAYGFGGPSESANDWGRAIITDADGNVYAAGYFNGVVDFDPGPGEAILSGGEEDGYLVKFTSSGEFVWVLEFGGSDRDRCHDVVIGPDGHLYISGTFEDTMTLPGSGPQVNAVQGTIDAFVSKYDTSGNHIWTHTSGGGSSDTAIALTVDAAGNVYYNGWTHGAVTINTAEGETSTTPGGGADTYVVKLDGTGSPLWMRQFAGPEEDWMFAVAAHPSGNICVSGRFRQSVDFDPGAGEMILTSAGQSDVAVFMLDADGQFVWAHRFGDTAFDSVRSIACDADGNIYLSGSFTGTIDFEPGAGEHVLTTVGGTDAFVSKMSSDGNEVWTFHTGGAMFDDGRAIAVGADGYIYHSGVFSDVVDFDPSDEVFTLTASDEDAFVAKISQEVIDFVGSKNATSSFSLYPNPTGGPFTIMLDEIHERDVIVVFRNSLGQEVVRRRLVNRHQQFFDEALAPGVYTVEILNQHGSAVKKLVVE